MILAVTHENGQVFQHFGHSKEFKLYTINDNAIASSEVRSTEGSGHGALATLLKNWGVTALICGGIGGGAKQALADAGIELFGGVTGDADTQVKNHLAGTLQYNSEATCSHHSHEEGHTCSGHHHH